MKRRIYVASSWRNTYQPGIVAALRLAGHEVYDFRNPAPGQKGFAWRDCGGAAAEGPGTGAKTIPAYLEAIQSRRACDGFALDKAALDWCDTCVLLLPCGRSAHLEAGYTAGQGKDTYFLLRDEQFEPELMYKLGTGCSTSIDQIIEWMAARRPGSVMRWHQENGGKFTRPSNHAIRLLREVVELCVAAGASENDINAALMQETHKAYQRGEFGVDHTSEIPEEWADCAMLLDVFAQHAGIDTHKEIRKKLDILWTRQWEADAGGALYRPASQSDSATDRG